MAKRIVEFYRSGDPRLLPAYSTREAARYLRMPEKTLRNWIFATGCGASGPQKRSRPLIRVDDPARRHLSFINLVEAHVLVGIRRHHGVRLPQLRVALDYVGRQFKIDRPLTNEAFQTDGLDVFVERYGDMINASRERQQGLKETIDIYLQRIARDRKGLPFKLYPFTRETDAAPAPLQHPRMVVISPTVSYGRPVVAGTGIPVTAVFECYKAGDSVADLASDFRLEIGAVEEAIRCEAA